MLTPNMRALNPVGWLFEAVRQYGREYWFGKFWGFYRGKVIDVSDPDKMGRVRILVPAFGHREEADVLAENWASPVSPGLTSLQHASGIWFPPSVGDPVWVFCEDGDVQRLQYLGGWWTKDGPHPLRHGDGLYRGLSTPSGHYLRMSDVEDDRHIVLAQGKGKGSQTGATVQITHQGTVVVTAQDGTEITLDAENHRVQVIASGGESVTLGSGSVTVEDGTGSKVEVGNGGITLDTSGAVTIRGASVTLDAPQVDIGQGAREPAVKGLALSTWAQSHTHATASPGSPTVPGSVVPPVVAGQHLSVGVRIG